MLLTLRRGEIIVMVTYDEPSAKLSTVARLLLHELGSSQAQNLQFRASWYLITYKGLNGYSPYEEINYPGSAGWGDSLYLNTCIPLKCKFNHSYIAEQMTQLIASRASKLKL